MKLSPSPLEQLAAIFKKGVQRVDPKRLILDSLSLEGNFLEIKTNDESKRFDLTKFEKIYVIGFGKASANMAFALEQLLANRISKGLVAVKYGHIAVLEKIELLEAGHPVPDENGLKAAKRIAELATEADSNTLVISLISGGGSALIPFPLETEIAGDKVNLTLADKQTVTQILLECGAKITEINCVRKHLSGIKGGRLAELLTPATSINLILSDVVGDRLDTIASGATVPDDTTFSDMQAIINKYDIGEKIPQKVLKILKAGLEGNCDDTPKSNDHVFENCHNFLIGTNYLALLAAKQEAESLGYETSILTSQLTGEAKEVAKVIYAIAKDTKKICDSSKPRCLLFGGETTVTIKGKGKGGRNQEMALSFLSEIENDGAAAEGIHFLAASTDGNDGPTDAAGAYASMDVLNKVAEANLSINEYLRENDSYHFFAQLGYLLKTGPTNTNVCDIQVVFVE